MAFEDYRIHEQIRLILIREWMDLTRLDYGVINGVVYVTGTLRRHAQCNGHANGNGNGQTPLEVELQARMTSLPGVRDVVFRLEPPKPGGTHDR